MSQEQDKQKWPSRAVNKVQSVVDEWNAFEPPVPVRIVWGYSDRQLEREERSLPKALQQPEALFQYGETDYEFLLAKAGDRHYPDRLSISLSFPAHDATPENGFELPLDDPRKLYSLLQCVSAPNELRSLPDPFSNSPRIVVVGCRTILPVESLSVRVLRDALQRLNSANEKAFNLLCHGKGEDHWALDSGE